MHKCATKGMNNYAPYRRRGQKSGGIYLLLRPGLDDWWSLTDEQWESLRWLVAEPPQIGRGRPRADGRSVLDAVIHVMLTGIKWNELPSSFGCSASTARRTYRTWVERGDWAAIWTCYLQSLEDEQLSNVVVALLDRMTEGTAVVLKVGTGVCLPAVDTRW